MAKRHKSAPSLTRIRSALTNGKFLLLGTDHRSAWMRRLRDLVAAHISDLGGDDNISHSERMLINRACMMILQLEMMEQAFASNDGVAKADEMQLYQRITNTLRRTLESLGLQRRPKAVPTLAEYLAQRADDTNEVVDAEAQD